jgi:hypothetical protein
MSADYIELEKKREQRARAENEQTYRRLTKVFALGMLGKPDHAVLTTARTALGISLEQFEADAVTIRREANLATDAADMPTIIKDLATQEHHLADLLAERKKVIDDIVARERVIRLNIDGLSRGRLRKEKAAADLAVLRRDHWQILGTEDPSLALKRRHLVQTVFGDDQGGAAYDVLVFEGVMQQPRAYGDLRDFEFIRLPHQQEAEFADLVARVLEIYSAALLSVGDNPTPIRWRYFIDAADLPRVRRSSEIANSESNDPHVCAHWYRFQRLPGQTSERLAVLEQTFQKALEKTRRAAGVTESMTDGLKGANVSVSRSSTTWIGPGAPAPAMA